MATAEEFRRIAQQQGFGLNVLSVVIGRRKDGGATLDLSEDLTLRQDPQSAVAISNGFTLILPRSLVEPFSDLVIDFRHGGYHFLTAAMPKEVTSHPIRVALSTQRLLQLSPGFASDENAMKRTGYYLSEGDGRAAVVLSVEPLVVAAYSDELYAVALLQFPDWLAADHHLVVGSRLLTSNSYVRGVEIASDLVRGAGATHRWGNIIPLIADFLTDDLARVAQRKADIAEDEWAEAFTLGQQAMIRARGRYRDGRPPNSGRAAY